MDDEQAAAVRVVIAAALITACADADDVLGTALDALHRAFVGSRRASGLM